MAEDATAKVIEWVGPPAAAGPFDTSAAHIARVYDYWLGGKDNYAADRAAGDEVIAAYPSIRSSVRAQRAFLCRVVRYLVNEAGIRQFLDIGTGLPAAENTHEVAQRDAPESRVMYVDNDPVVLAHARALLTSSPEGATGYVEADLRDTSTVLRRTADVLDFGKPLAIFLVGVLHCIPDDDSPRAVVARLLAAAAPGSYLVIGHPASDIDAGQVAAAATRLNQMMTEPVTLRGYLEVARFFAGLDLVEPGLVQLHRWRPGPKGPDPSHDIANYGAVGQKAGRRARRRSAPA